MAEEAQISQVYYIAGLALFSCSVSVRCSHSRELPWFGLRNAGQAHGAVELGSGPGTRAGLQHAFALGSTSVA